MNKMDLVGFEESVFAGIRQDFRALLGKLEFDRITPIPICARDGDNVTGPSARMPWYGAGSLLQALESAAPMSAQGGPFRMPVQSVIPAGPYVSGLRGHDRVGTGAAG